MYDGTYDCIIDCGFHANSTRLDSSDTVTMKEEKKEFIDISHDVLPKRVKRARRSREVDEKEGVVKEKTKEVSVTLGENGEQRDDTVDALINQIEKYGLSSPKYEYLDHTADVQLHSWGETLEEAFENLAMCMFNYMTPLKGILKTCLSEDKKNIKIHRFTMTGNDMESMVYHWLDELLFQFSTGFFVPVAIKITEFDLESWTIKAVAVGDVFDTKIHACGTEIKAITYSAMQIYKEKDGRKNPKGTAELYVIVDI